MPLTDTASVAALLGRDLTDPETARADILIAFASAEVIDATGQTFELVEDDDVVLDCYGGEIVLPQAPIVEVTSVVIDPAFASYTPPADQWEVLGRTLLLRRPRYRFLQTNQTWPIRLGIMETFTGKVRVVYTHGGTVPVGVSAVIAEVVADTFRQQAINAANPNGLLLDKLDDGESRYAPNAVTAASVRIPEATLEALVARYGFGSWSPRTVAQ